MRHRWPEDTRFTHLVLEGEDHVCAVCGGVLHICDHRRHRIFTLQGPVEMVCKLAHCADRQCAAHAKTRSPYAETTLTLPWWLIGWDVFCLMGHRRFARHWSVPQIRSELADTYQIPLSADAIEDAVRRYQTMLAARQQDPQVLTAAYRNVEALVLSIDGLQPEKGHETLYVVRELNAKRIWFAEALLSSNADEVRRLVSQARAWATQLGLPVHLWLSDKQDAFVTGIAAEFPEVPHRYCVNHFLRDVATPMLETDRHAKVKMRSKVRGLRAIERELVSDSLVYRYRLAGGFSDGLTGQEGTFSMCSFWYVECLSRMGDLHKARFFFEKMLGYANHLGLYGEELGPQAQHLGNFPQAFTHVALVNTAFNLSQQERRSPMEQRAPHEAPAAYPDL